MSDSRCRNRSKTSNCNGVYNRNADEVGCPSRVAFAQLSREIERELQSSERALCAANNYLGSSSRVTPMRRYGSHNRIDFPSIPHMEHPVPYEKELSCDGIRFPSRASTTPNTGRSKQCLHDHGGYQQVETPSPYHYYQQQQQQQQQQQHYRHHHHDHYDSRSDVAKLKKKSVQSICHLSGLKPSSTHDYCELDKDSEIFRVCYPKEYDKKIFGSKVAILPEAPKLMKEHIEELISCETKDVESAWQFTSEERTSSKKPCPKQMKAQMGVKNIVQTFAEQNVPCGRKFTKLEHPEPEDISPDVAAAMMFLEEEGVKMNECPYYTITRLFPKDPTPELPEKGSVSVVNQSGADQQRMMEKSTTVPSEGVSDSAYTRRMIGKGELGPQKSYDVDFAIGQSKREYVFVTEKPERVNLVQFRGKTPSWFPWYFSAFPDDKAGGLKVSSSPSGVFYKAWLHSNPKNMPPNDVIVLE